MPKSVSSSNDVGNKRNAIKEKRVDDSNQKSDRKSNNNTQTSTIDLSNPASYDPAEVFPNDRAVAEKFWPKDYDTVAAMKKKPFERDVPMFSSFELTKDPNAKKYMEFDTVVYPNFARQVAPEFRSAELDSLWLSGFLDEGYRQKKKAMESIVAEAKGKLTLAQQREIARKKIETPGDRLKRIGYTKLGKNIPTITGPEMALDFAHESFKDREEEEREKEKARKLANKKERTLFVQPEMKSSDFEALFDFSRLCHESAFRIQRIYRRWIVWKAFHAKWNQYLAAKKIQALVRGVITRRWVAEWYFKRVRMTIQWQARIRKYLAVKAFREMKVVYFFQASKIVKVVRGYLAKRRVINKRRNIAALAIQSLWRGVLARGEANKIWLDLQVSRIQRIIRSWIQKKRYKVKRRIWVECTGRIQRSLRGYIARQRRNSMLHKGEYEAKEHNIQILAAEEDRLYASRLQQKKRIQKTKLTERAAAAEKAFQASLDDVEIKELDYLGFQRKKKNGLPKRLCGRLG